MRLRYFLTVSLLCCTAVAMDNGNNKQKNMGNKPPGKEAPLYPNRFQINGSLAVTLPPAKESSKPVMPKNRGQELHKRDQCVLL